MLFKVPLSFNRDFHNYKLKLEPVIGFCNRVDNPQSDLKIIHVAGTNGKGSTCHITASIIQEHGKNVGIFSSPHLIDFREKIKINPSQEISIQTEHFNSVLLGSDTARLIQQINKLNQLQKSLPNLLINTKVNIVDLKDPSKPELKLEKTLLN